MDTVEKRLSEESVTKRMMFMDDSIDSLQSDVDTDSAPAMVKQLQTTSSGKLDDLPVENVKTSAIGDESVTKRIMFMDDSIASLQIDVDTVDSAPTMVKQLQTVISGKLDDLPDENGQANAPTFHGQTTSLFPDYKRLEHDRRPSWVLEVEEEKLCTFDEKQCYNGSPLKNKQCRILRRISNKIMSGDDLETDGKEYACSTNDTEVDDSTCSNVSTYLMSVADDTRTKVAKYLSSGKLEHIHLSMDNIHNIFHVATSLNLQQLRRHCMEFCSVHNRKQVFSHFDDCHCKREIVIASKAGYERSQSVTSNPDDKSTPEYFIVFSKDIATTGKLHKIGVIVIDMSERMDIFNREMEKPQFYRRGFGCCSVEKQDAPYVFVCGGEGKGSHLMWKYDVLLNRWDKCPKLHHGRSKHVMVAVKNGSIFVLGGKEVACIEEYNIKSHKWAEHGSLATHVFSAVGAVFDEKIYVFGGKTPAGAVATIQCYDTASKKLSKLDDLPCAFFGGQAVVIGNNIYIATGQGHMICFEALSGASYLCLQQPVQRKHFGMFVKNERIYLVGGVLVDDEDEGRMVETPQYRYNPEKNSWVEKYKLCKSFPVYASCIIKYAQKCAVIPFNDKL